MDRSEASNLFIASTQAMFASGAPLMQRVIGNADGEAQSWSHYPESDVVNGGLSARWFYHCHAPEERGENEHGHFHLFVGKPALPAEVTSIMPAPPTKQKRADVVHVAALSINHSGLPTDWFTVNRWVTDEWLYPASSITDMLGKIDFRGPSGDPLVNDWLTALVALQREPVARILAERDAVIARDTVQAEDRGAEILSSTPLNLETLLD
ncbi:DUF6969 family protein [Pontixanthobacter sp.]|uniref:DUF6969 family protein n=1 Tax=Pontixanthobacter sp. TaxID=2792078 RepID=UPI003C7E9913